MCFTSSVRKDVAVSILGSYDSSWCCALTAFAVGACSHYVWSPLSVFPIQKPRSLAGQEDLSSHEELDLSEDLGVSSQVTGRWLAGANPFLFLSNTSVVPLFLSSMAVPGFDFAPGSETLATSQLSHVKCSLSLELFIPLRMGYGCFSSESSGLKRTIKPRYLPISPSQRVCSWDQEPRLMVGSVYCIPDIGAGFTVLPLQSCLHFDSLFCIPWVTSHWESLCDNLVGCPCLGPS